MYTACQLTAVGVRGHHGVSAARGCHAVIPQASLYVTEPVPIQHRPRALDSVTARPSTLDRVAPTAALLIATVRLFGLSPFP